MPQDSGPKKRDVFLDFDTHLTPPGGKSWFFGIGINEYTHFTPLLNAVKDVQDIVKILQERYDLLPEQTFTLYNKEATRKNIISMLDRLQKEVGPQDKLVIYYSGHGYLNKEIGKGYWIPTNAERDNTAAYIRNSTIREYIETLKALHTLLISDSCFSGSLFVRGASRSGAAINELESLPSRWALCSGRHNEEVFDGEPGKNSPFAESIIDTLKRNQNKEFNVAKLADRVVEQTRSNYQQLPEGNPLFGVGHKGGQYIFRLKANEADNWAFAKEEGTIAAFQQFLVNHPDGEHADKARKQIATLEEDLAWKKATQNNSVSAYIQYRRAYPEGRYRDQALEAVQNLEEDQTWKIAKRRDNIFEYEKYLEEYPKGKYAKEANEALSLLLNKEKEKEEQQENSVWQAKKEEKSQKAKPAPVKKESKVEQAAPTTKPAPPASKPSFFKKNRLVLAGGGGALIIALIVFAMGGFGPSYPTGYARVDGKSYRTITIDGLTWMAENLDYETPEGSSYPVYGNDPYKDYGLLYTVEAAKEACSAIGKEWRLPTAEDWELLAAKFGKLEIWEVGKNEPITKGKNTEKNKLYRSNKKSFFAAEGTFWRKQDWPGNSYDRVHPGPHYWSSTPVMGREEIPFSPEYKFISIGNYSSSISYAYKDSGRYCRCVKGDNPANTDGTALGANTNAGEKVENPVSKVTLGEQSYNTVQINGLTWMADNLNYPVENAAYPKGLKFKSLQQKVGLLYTRNEASKACKELGWRLPTTAEVEALIDKYGGYENAYTSLIKGGKSGFAAVLSSGTNYQDGISTGEGTYHMDDTRINTFFQFASNEKYVATMSVQDTYNPNRRFVASCRCVKD
jgi:uncharacterized protein (TIGR02145 family)